MAKPELLGAVTAEHFQHNKIRLIGIDFYKPTQLLHD